MTRRTFALSLAAGTAAAETANDRGKRLVDKTIEALGGDVFRDMQTRTEIGQGYTFYRDRLTGLSPARIYTKYLEPSGKAELRELQRQVLGKSKEDAVLFTPGEAYDVTYRGAQPLPADQIAQFLDNALHNVFYILRERLGEPGLDFEGAGADVVENQPVEAIDFYDSENRNVRVWVNSDTFLPVKQRFYRWDPLIGDRHEEVTLFSKYRRTVNGLMWPHETERVRDNEKVSQLQLERVTVNNVLPDSMFRLPNGIKMLKQS